MAPISRIAKKHRRSGRSESMSFDLLAGRRSECFNPIALRKAKIVYNLGLSECNRIKVI